MMHLLTKLWVVVCSMICRESNPDCNNILKFLSVSLFNRMRQRFCLC
jgi:hypothetical protein